MQHARAFRLVITALIAIQQVLGPSSGVAGAAASQQQEQLSYAFKPVSPRAIPSVAIIGTAKAGTTDLYTLLRQTSHSNKPSRKRTKEAKLLIEDGRTVLPGHPDFDEYLERIGHPCASSPQSNTSTAGAFELCMQQLVASYPYVPASSTRNGTQQQAAGTEATATAAVPPSKQASNGLPLSIDGTTFYLALPRAMQALKAISNDTKIIILLRHPVDRAQSLYNHRVNTERNKVLPARVMNRTISEWAKMFLTWVNNTPKVKPLLESLGHEISPQRQAELYQQLIDLNLLGLPDGPLTFPKYNRQGHIARNIFGPAFYAAALSVWRTGYFKPGSVMIIDSHEFFARRLEVLNDVYKFVHGQSLSVAGRRIAQSTAIQNSRRRRGVVFDGAKFDTSTQQRIEAFYKPHNDMLLDTVLPALQQEGALVVGFNKPPWVSQEQH